MRVLVGCEFSQIITKAFRKKGHDAYSCDILPTEGETDWHIQGDVLEVINQNWDLGIFHPPCTYLSYVATRHWNKPGRAELREDALAFFMLLINAPIKRICVENPVGYPNTVYRKPDQIIHPYYFGDAVQKRTCLWLKNLPLLTWDKDAAIKPPPLYKLSTTGKSINWTEGIKGGKNRSKMRSTTFQGIADAMSEQWPG